MSDAPIVGVLSPEPQGPTPKIYLPDAGVNNEDLNKSRVRLVKGYGYRDLATIIIVPTRGMIPARVVQSWLSMVPLMNQKLARLVPTMSAFASGLEVGEAYNQTIASVLVNPELSKYKFILTMEEDNMPPPTGLHRLLESLIDGPWAAVGGLYWTKGEGGQPMIYGDPKTLPLNFLPQVPEPDTVQECRGLGMGFTLFDINVFRDPDLPYPWFKTISEPGRSYTQDLYFFERACRQGYRFACDTRVRVGHLDPAADIVW